MDALGGFVETVILVAIGTIIFAPEHNLFLKWARLKESRRKYGLYFYISLFWIIPIFHSTIIEFNYIKLTCSLLLFYSIFRNSKILRTGILPQMPFRLKTSSTSNNNTGNNLEDKQESKKFSHFQSTIQDEWQKAIDRQKATKDAISSTLANQTIEEEVYSAHFKNLPDSRIDTIHDFDDLPNFHPELNVRGQTTRRERARECRVISVDKVNNCGVFKGSSRDRYNTTLNSCECRDFELRHRACKHMFRLAHEIGIIHIDGCPSGKLYNCDDPMEKYTIGAAKELIEKLSVDERQVLYRLLCQWINVSSQNEWIYERDEPISNKLIECGFLQEKWAPEKIWPILKMAEIRAFIKEQNGQKCPVKKNDAVLLLRKMGDDYCSPLIHQYKYTVFDDGFKPIRGKMCYFLRLLLGDNRTPEDLKDMEDTDEDMEFEADDSKNFFV